MPGTSRSCSQGISTHWGTWRLLNVQENNCCNGFGMRGHWQGQVPLCLQPHQVSHPSNRRWKTSHRNPVRGNRHKHLTTGSSSQFPTIMAETEEEGFLLWQKILLPGDTLACDICVRLLCTAPHGCDRDMAFPGHMWLSPLLCQCMTTPGRPLHRELKSNLDK